MNYELAARIFRYEPETGFIYWNIDHHNNMRAGDRAGCLDVCDGYRKVIFQGRQYREHRVIWLLHYKKWPNKHIDHINRNRADNKISNLRLATCSQNAVNRTVDSRNKSGVPGVYWSKEHNKWKVQIGVNGKRVFLGLYANVDEAKSARLNADKKYFDGFRFQAS